ncbi:VRR-NUC domain-containing protein [bacterium]|nr:VRR-NUC domain-containing protein [bacterium]
MAMTPEAKVKKVVTNYLKKMGAYYFYPATGGYGKSGVPDIVACYKGLFFGIECKAGKGKTTALQQKNLEDIKTAGGFDWVVNEENMHTTEEVLKLYSYVVGKLN